MRREDSDHAVRFSGNIQHQAADLRIQRRRQLMQFPDAEFDWLGKKTHARINIGIQILRIGRNKAYTEGGITPFFRQAASIQQNTANVQKGFLGRKHLILFKVV